MHWTPGQEAELRVLGLVSAVQWITQEGPLPILLLRLGEWCRTVGRDPGLFLGDLIDTYLSDELPVASRPVFERHQGGHPSCPCPDCLGFEFDAELLTFTPYEPD